MKRTLHYTFSFIMGLTPALFSNQSLAEDWTISATGSCETSLGNTVNLSGGLRASGGTAVVTCPLTKEVGATALNTVYARMRRNSASGADPFCNINTKNLYGSPTDISYGFAADHTNNQSINIPIPTNQYSIGYADVTCVLNSGDTLYGVRYQQDN